MNSKFFGTVLAIQCFDTFDVFDSVCTQEITFADCVNSRVFNEYIAVTDIFKPILDELASHVSKVV